VKLSMNAIPISGNKYRDIRGTSSSARSLPLPPISPRQRSVLVILKEVSDERRKKMEKMRKGEESN
jgi:hypothetical protein